MKQPIKTLLFLAFLTTSFNTKESPIKHLDYIIRETITTPNKVWRNNNTTLFYEKQIGLNTYILFADHYPHAEKRKVIGREDKIMIRYGSDTILYKGKEIHQGYRTIRMAQKPLSPEYTITRSKEILKDIKMINELNKPTPMKTKEKIN